MTRETKIGLLVGMGVILFIGILISDYLSSATRQTPADLTQVDRGRDVAPSPIVERSTPLPEPRAARPGRDVQLLGTDEPTAAQRRAAEHEVVGPIYRVETPESAFQVDRLTQTTEPPIDPTPHIGTADRQPSAPATPRDRVHHVREGETLFVIAEKYYGNGEYYMSIYEANRNKMTSPNHLRAGVRLVIPNRAGTIRQGTPAPGSESEPAPAQRYTTYTVKRGDSLSVLAQKFFGTTKALPKLIELNRDKIADPDWVPVGTVLKVPADGDLAAAR